MTVRYLHKGLRDNRHYIVAPRQALRVNSAAATVEGSTESRAQSWMCLQNSFLERQEGAAGLRAAELPAGSMKDM